MTENTLTFIGAGNMASSLIAGLIDDKTPLKLQVSDPDPIQRDHIQRQWSPIKTFDNNRLACDHADVIVLAVKPQILTKICHDIKDIVQKTKPLIISVAAGITEEVINKALGGNMAIVRCMPNTPALVQAGATGLYANDQANTTQRNLAEMVLRAVGITLWVDKESLIDSITAVSGSGPAYFFLVMEAMQNTAMTLGLSKEEAQLLVVQTALGAAKLAMESNDDAGLLRQRVTSKGGTTEAAIKVLQDGGLEDLFSQALNAAAQRSIELAKAN
ncbi:MAG: pyrroline-5-carboxylate reductase [Thiotrichaceae bacterium]|nr:pyrroline-5-carboxylate reductase [Thiotrichaceae bacterium]